MSTGRVAVVGGGVTGLAAAHALVTSDPTVEVLLLEAADRLGGKVRTGEVGGVRVELGAEAFLARERGAVELCEDLGLGGDLVDQSARGVGIWWDGALRPLPQGVVLGVPTRLRTVAASGLVSPIGAARAALDLVLPRIEPLEERSIGEVVRRRLGVEVAERLVDPLLSGVYAGDIDRLSATAATPILAEALADHRSLILGLRARMRAARARAGSGGAGPVFATLSTGLSRLVERLTEHERIEVRTGVRATALRRETGGFRLGTHAGSVDVDGVLLATPAPVTAGLLTEVAPEATGPMRDVRYASVAVVVLVLPESTVLPDGSGILVPRTAGRDVKAATWVSSKWAHVGAGEVVVRASVGRDGDDAILALDDPSIVARVRDDLAELAGVVAEPLATHVERWSDALPQYEVGHERRVAEVRAAVDGVPGLAAAGAAFDGVGIPACIADGQRAAQTVLTGLSTN